MDCSFSYLYNILLFLSEDPRATRIEPFGTAEITDSKTGNLARMTFFFLFWGGGAGGWTTGTDTEIIEKQQTGAVVYVKLTHLDLLY